MWDFCTHLLDASGFPPRWGCGAWTSGHGWLHILSNVAVWAAYSVIPCVLWFNALRRKDFPFRLVLYLFSAFILVCGLTHLMDALLFWWPAYRLDGVLKLATAVVSWATVFALVRVTPQLIALRAPAELEAEITVRKRVEGDLRALQSTLEDRVAERTASLQLSEKRFRAVVEATPAGLVMVDRTGRIVFVNSVAEQMFGWERDELVAQTLERLLPDSFRDGHPTYRTAFFEAPEERPMGGGRALSGRRKDGSEFPVEVGLRPVETTDGLLTLASVIDITVRLRGEAAVKVSEERFRAAMDASLHGISFLKAERDGSGTVTDFRITNINRSGSELISQRQEEVVGRLLCDVEPQSRLGGRFSKYVRVVETGEPSVEEFQFGPQYGTAAAWVHQEVVRIGDGLVVTSQDITDRKGAEDALRELNQTLERRVAERATEIESQRRLLDAILDALPVAVIIAGPTGRITRMNPACQRVWGSAPMSDGRDEAGEWVGYWPDTGRRIAPEEWALSRALLSGEVCSDELVEFERFGDRARRLIMNSAAPVFGQDGGLAAGVVVSTDVTEKKAEAAALRRSEERLRLAIEATGMGVWDTPLPATTLGWDERLRAMWGLPAAAEVAYTQALEMVHPDDRPTVEQMFASSFDPAGDGRAAVEHRILTPDGERWVAVWSQCVFDRTVQGRVPVRSIGVMLDVTDRRRTEERLKEGEERYRAVVEDATEIVCRFRSDGTILFVNGVYCRTFHKTVGELVGTNWAPVVHPDDLPVIRANLSRMSESEPIVRIENRVFDTEGRVRWVEFVNRGFFDGGGCLREVQAVGRDVTERKRAEADLQTALDEVRRSNAELERFAYVASHDLQEPLRAVAGCVQVLRNQYAGQLDPAADELIHHAVDGARRMQALIHDLLDYSRVATQKAEVAPVDFGTALERAVTNLDGAVTEAGAAVTGGPLPVVEGNEAQIVQLFQNFVGNAIKYRGTAPPVVHVSARPVPGGWEFAVRDNGIGIAPKHFGRIFVIFQRLHTRTEYPGTGIGLAICKRIVERHGGRIWVESAVGDGSTFFFTIPDRRAES